MHKTLVKAVGFLACVAWFNFASAASLGGINVTSALGHPLKAEISLTELGNTDKTTLVAKLASVNEFRSAGLDYPYSLPKFSFEVDTYSNGEAYIKLTSTQAVNEPFVSILIELSWPAGKLLREYTFLLDPAGFVAEQPKLAEVKPVEAMVPLVPVVVSAVAAMPVNTLAALPLAEEKKVPDALPATEVESLAVSQQAVVATESLLVNKGDTLGKIADGVKPVDVSLERMLVAMYRANAQEFEGKNMNRIKKGKILRMPDAAEIEQVTQKEAVKEIRAQVVDWQDYRQKLAASQSARAEQAPKQTATGKVSAAVSEKTPVFKETAKEVLRLSKGETLGDKTIPGGGAKNKQEALIANADDATAKSMQLQEEKKKVAKLEAINKEASRLLELKGASLTPLESKPVEKAPTPAEGEGLAAVSSVPATAAATEELDVVAKIKEYLAKLKGYLVIWMDNPTLLGAGAAVLLGLGGLGFIAARRSKANLTKVSQKKEKIGASTGSWRAPVPSSPETGDFTKSATSAPMSVAAALEDVDPISEAELFLNFGRDVQAEEILKDALTKTPLSVQIKLKLLSIYVNRKDIQTFSKYAQEIKDSGDDAAWERAAVMGLEVDPINPIYGDAKGAVRQRDPVKAELDFDLGLGNMESPAVDTQDFKMDFDLTSNLSTAGSQSVDLDMQFAAPTVSSKLNASAEVDATSILSRELVNAAQQASPMDFDVSGMLPGDVKDVVQTSTMDFDLSGEIPAANKPAASTGIDFDDLIFDIPTAQSEPAQEKPKAVADDSMDFTIDFPTSDSLDSASGAMETAKKLDIDFGDININLDEDSPAVNAGGESKGEQWHEVATKLDLAKAYQEMGDADGAREILEEVIRDGDVDQRESAAKLMNQITA